MMATGIAGTAPAIHTTAWTHTDTEYAHARSRCRYMKRNTALAMLLCTPRMHHPYAPSRREYHHSGIALTIGVLRDAESIYTNTTTMDGAEHIHHSIMLRVHACAYTYSMGYRTACMSIPSSVLIAGAHPHMYRYML